MRKINSTQLRQLSLSFKDTKMDKILLKTAYAQSVIFINKAGQRIARIARFA